MTVTRTRKKELAITAIANGATKSGAARAAGIDRKTLYRWLDADLDFLMEFDAAWRAAEEKRTYLLWKNHYARGRRPPPNKRTRAVPRFSR
jgi:transposase-like protein